MITLKLKDKKYCSHKKWLGETKWISRDKVEIIISTETNKSSLEFFITLLHELLHVWVSVMKVNGLKIKREHPFIYRVEFDVIKRFKELCSGGLK